MSNRLVGSDDEVEQTAEAVAQDNEHTEPVPEEFHHHRHEGNVEEIEVAAYYIWLNDGAVPNDPDTERNWLEAEKQICEQP